MIRKSFVMIGALAVLVTGCSDDDDGATDDVSEEARPYVDALIASAESGDSDIPFESGEAECLAPRWVEILDPARLEAAGISPEDLTESDDAISELGLSEDDGGALYDSMVDCGVDLRAQFLDEIAADSDLSDEDRACLEEQFDDDFLRRLFVIVLSQGEDALQSDENVMSEMFDIFSECPGAAPQG